MVSTATCAPVARGLHWMTALLVLAEYSVGNALTLILKPLAGWASACAHGYPARAFGILSPPALVPYRARIGFILGMSHADVLYWIFLALIAMHVGAALYHRFVKRDSVPSSMLPGVQALTPPRRSPVTARIVPRWRIAALAPRVPGDTRAR